MCKKNYSLASNLVFLLRQLLREDKYFLIAMLAQGAALILLPLTDSYISKYVVMAVESRQNISGLLLVIGIFSMARIALEMMKNSGGVKVSWDAYRNRFHLIGLCYRKIMKTDYPNIESKEGQNKRHLAMDGIAFDNSGSQAIFGQIVGFCVNAGGLCVCIVFFYPLGLPFVLCILLFSILGCVLKGKQNIWREKHQTELAEAARKREYIQNRYGDLGCAKELRLYHMASWFRERFRKSQGECLAWKKKEIRYGFMLDGAVALTGLIREGLFLTLLIYRVWNQEIDIGEFVFYFSLMSACMSWITGFIESSRQISGSNICIRNIRMFLDMEDLFNHGEGVEIPEKGSLSIVFDNVSYRYSDTEPLILDHISFSVKAGEKIAVVGENGAGKTTLVKLLCGLTEPVEGRILLGGAEAKKLNREEYYKLFSVVFQDIHLLPVTVAENVICREWTGEQEERDKIQRALRMAGLWEKVEKMPEKEDTYLLKGIREVAVDLSGGEKQKLALARALYENRKLLILDEPTAALDPIAEGEMYMRYADLTKGKTSIFISHRLSSTRFCDRILFMENGKITESGTHEELMEKNGKYAALFALQSKYYQECG